ncbi:MAG: YIP1 family protein [Fermentimonas sp.]|jgi:hypothetical protein
MWKNIYSLVVQLITAPSNAWMRIKEEGETLNFFTKHFLHPVFGIISLASFIGGLWFSKSGNIENALKMVIVNLISVYGGYYIAAYILNEIAPRYGLAQNISRFSIFTGYSSVVIYLIFMLSAFFPNFFIIWVLAIYTVVLINAGTIYYLDIAEQHRANFSLISSAIVMFVPIIINQIFRFMVK